MESAGFSETELRKFSESGRVIAAAIGTSAAVVARGEMGSILKAWAATTKAATETKAKNRARFSLINSLGFDRRRHTSNVFITPGTRSRAPGTIMARIKGNRWLPVGRVDDHGDSRWFFQQIKNSPLLDAARRAGTEYALRVATSIAEGIKTIGLGRQSIIQIADDLGIDLSTIPGARSLSPIAITKARGAVASSGRSYKNGYGQSNDLTSPNFYIELVNRYPRLIETRMDRGLQLVLRGRMKYFQKNLEEGTFLSAKRAARAYPYVEVLRSVA